MKTINLTVNDIRLKYFYSSKNEKSLEIKSELEQMANDNGGSEFFSYFDITENPDEFKDSKVYHTPTAVITRNGEEFARIIHGVTAKNCAKVFIEAFKYNAFS